MWQPYFRRTCVVQRQGSVSVHRQSVRWNRFHRQRTFCRQGRFVEQRFVCREQTLRRQPVFFFRNRRRKIPAVGSWQKANMNYKYGRNRKENAGRTSLLAYNNKLTFEKICLHTRKESEDNGELRFHSILLPVAFQNIINKCMWLSSPTRRQSLDLVGTIQMFIQLLAAITTVFVSESLLTRDVL